MPGMMATETNQTHLRGFKNAPMNEEALIGRAQRGDAAAFEQLLELHYDRIYRFAYKWCSNQNDAEDVAQQACIKLGQSIRQYRHEAAFTSWLYRIVLSCAQDWFRKEQRHRGANDDDIDGAIYSATEGASESASERGSGETHVYLHQVMCLLDKMAEGFKETALLVLAEGLTHQEAAYILHVKESTVSWRLHEIRKQLSQVIPAEDRQ